MKFRSAQFFIVAALIPSLAFCQDNQSNQISFVPGRDNEDPGNNPLFQKLSPDFVRIASRNLSFIGQRADGSVLVEKDDGGTFDGLPNMGAPGRNEKPLPNSDQLVVSYAPGKEPTAEMIRAAGFELLESNHDGNFIVVKPVPAEENPSQAARAAGMQTSELLSLTSQPWATYVDRNIIFSIPEDQFNPPASEADQLSTGPQNAESELNAVPGIRRTGAHLIPHFRSASNVVVAIIDTGVDYRHSDLRQNMWVNIAEANGVPGVDDDGNGIVDDVHGATFVDGWKSGDSMDDHGHGTHCAGTVAAVANGQGVIGISQAKIMGLKFLKGNRGGRGSMTDAVRCIDYARKNGANVMSNSWGGQGQMPPVLEQAIARAAQAGILFVAAAGNKNMNIDQIPYAPANSPSPNVLAVGSVNFRSQRSGFSNYGIRNVDVGAAGGGLGGNIYSTLPNNRYGYMAGTSMAAPHVSGAAALILSTPGYQSAHYSTVKQAILQSAVSNSALSSWFQNGRELNVGFLGGSHGGNTQAATSKPSSDGQFYYAHGHEISGNTTLITRKVTLPFKGLFNLTTGTSIAAVKGSPEIVTGISIGDKNYETSRRALTLGAGQKLSIVGTTLSTTLEAGEYEVKWWVKVPDDYKASVIGGGSMDIQAYASETE